MSGNAHNFDGLAPISATITTLCRSTCAVAATAHWVPPAEYNPVVNVADLDAAITALGLDRVTLIGTSMGGIISMIFAGGYPDRVERLVLNDIGPESDPSGLQRITDYFTDEHSGFRDMAEVAAYYRANYPFLTTPEPESPSRWLGSQTCGRTAA